MPLTHEQIAAMTCAEVNKEIAIRRSEEVTKPVGFLADSVSQSDVTGSTGSAGIRALFLHPDYCHDWSHAGRLLNDFDDFALSKRVNVSECSVFTERGDIDHSARTAPEAIARCWLEWWEVTHE